MHIRGKHNNSRAKKLDEIVKEKDLKDWNKIKPKKKDEKSNRTLVAIKNIVFLVYIYFKNIIIRQSYYLSVWHRDDHHRKLLLIAWVLSLENLPCPTNAFAFIVSKVKET